MKNEFNLRKFLAENKRPVPAQVEEEINEEEVEESAPGFEHDCAAHVVHETYGYGICLEGQHTLVENAEGKHVVTHYDVFFKEGSKTVENIPVEELKVLTESNHGHAKNKKKNEEVAELTKEDAFKNEIKDLLDS
jgi:hypothetical protein